MLQQIYSTNLALHTDLYQLTMAYGYWKNGIHDRESVFHLFFRKAPFRGKMAIACGIEYIKNYLANFSFTQEDIDFLGQLKGQDEKALFEKGFLDYLLQLKFSCDVDAMEEGTICFPHQPLIRVKGPLLQAQLIETAMLNIVNFQTLIATKAHRICEAAKGDTVLEFGLRRSQGIDGGLSASRAAFIGGCHATSNVLAAKLFDIPVKGTHAHSWVMCFEDEIEAFQKYADAMPNNCVFLVDTYDTLEGVENAITIGKKLRAQGNELLGIRLDSGDLADLSIKARKRLDEAGFASTKIIASNDLDEYRIQALKDKGAKIAVWGVGTRLSTAYDQAALGGVYKLAAIKNELGIWEDRIKLSEQRIKVSNPGSQQVVRGFKNQKPIMDVIVDVQTLVPSLSDDPTISWKPLLVPIFKRGQLHKTIQSTQESRIFREEQVQLFDTINLTDYPVQLDVDLENRKEQLLQKVKNFV